MCFRQDSQGVTWQVVMHYEWRSDQPRTRCRIWRDYSVRRGQGSQCRRLFGAPLRAMARPVNDQLEQIKKDEEIDCEQTDPDPGDAADDLKNLPGKK